MKVVHKTSQLITVTGQIHGCLHYYSSLTSKHLAPFSLSHLEQVHAHTHTCRHTHAHTHTHAYSLSLSLSLCCGAFIYFLFWNTGLTKKNSRYVCLLTVTMKITVYNKNRHGEKRLRKRLSTTGKNTLNFTLKYSFTDC